MPRIATSFVSVVMTGSSSLATLGHCTLIGITSAHPTVNAAVSDVWSRALAPRSEDFDVTARAGGVSEPNIAGEEVDA
jgi:hypothetical protein